MAAIPYKMFTHHRLRAMLERYIEDPSVFATENEYYLALYADEMWRRLNALKAWTERYRLNTESIEARVKKEKALPKSNRMDLTQWEEFMHRKILALHECELGRREIMDIE